MKLFSSNLNYLGIDIGSTGIKVVELKNENGRPRLVTYGFAEEPIDIIHDSSPHMQQKIINLLLTTLESAQTTTKKVVVSLPSFSVFSSIISLPAMNRKELDKAIHWQAKKFVPLPLEEMTLDWKLLTPDKKIEKPKNKEIEQQENEKTEEQKADKEKDNKKSVSTPEKSGVGILTDDIVKKENLKILIAAAPKKLVLKYINIFKTVGLELLSLETENFALERSLVGGDKAPIMIVDIGSITTDITVVENSIPLLSRSIDSGGQTITNAILNTMHIDKKRAEQFKRDIGFSSSQGNLPKIIETSITPVINEIKYCFNLYASQQSQQGIEKIILTGGSSFLPKIDEYLSKLLNIKVMVGDPWSKIIYPVELKPILTDLAPRFSVAIGLALRDII